MTAAPPPLWEHQRRAVDFARARFDADAPGALWAMDMGTGKSRAALHVIEHWHDLRAASDGGPVLIAAPKSVVRNWEQEFERYYRGEPLRLIAHPGGPAARSVRAVVQAATAGRRWMLIANYESLLSHRPLGRAVNRVGKWSLIVADEAHKLKSPGSNVSRRFAALAQRSAFNLALTGTPLPHSPLDGYALMRFVDPSIFGTSFARFKRFYTRAAETAEDRADPLKLMENRGGALTRIVLQNLTTFNRRMGTATFRVEAGDVLSLPEVVEQSVLVGLEAEARRIYRDLEHDFFAWVNEEAEERITAAHAGVKVMRMAQVTGGSAPIEDDGGQRRGRVISTAKREALADVLDGLAGDEPVVVFCRFVADLEAVAGTAGAGYRELSGARNELAEWQEGGGRVLGVQVQAGSVGVNLTRARYAVFYSLPISLALYQQARARLVRPGQEGATVHLIHLAAAGTIDERIHRALLAREEVLSVIIDEFKRGSLPSAG